jgi:hypothetical protein
MHMSEAAEVVQVAGAGNANKKLSEGWTLLAVTSGSNGAERDQQVVWYVLGKKAPAGSVRSEPLMM